MTDTTIQNPSEVQDMVDKLKGMLQHISDTFVNASQLASTVQDLQTRVNNMSQQWADEVGALKQEIEHVRQQNATLDETIQHIRRERDEAQHEAAHLREEVANVSHHRDELSREVESSHNRIAELEAQLSQVKRDHDEAEYRAMHWEEQHKSIKTQLDGIKAALGVAAAPSPEPQREEQRTGTWGS